jgi:transcriptional regulator with XRE-family HTH domain
MAKSRGTHADRIFRTLLKDLRRSQGLSQAALAERLGLPQSYVSKYETGERRLDFVETAVLCDALNTSLVALATEFSAKLARPARARRT